MSAWGVEGKLRSFLQFAIDKLDGACVRSLPLLLLCLLPLLRLPLRLDASLTPRSAASRQEALEDEDPEDNFQELCVFALGFSRNLKNTGAAAPAELKGAIAASLAEFWDIKTDSPGEGLREAGVPGLKGGMEALLAGPLAAPEAEPEPEPEDDGEAPADEADAARAARLARQQARPANLGDMSLQEAVTYMWDVLDKPDRVEWGEEGFTLDLQNKGRYGKDRCAAPLFTTVNLEHPFWAHPVTKAFIDLLDNYERETGKREVVTRGEKKEMADFMDALCQTPVIQFLFNYLKVHGKDPRCKKLRTIYDLSSLLYDLWLAPYRRAAANDSSGFEHVSPAAPFVFSPVGSRSGCTGLRGRGEAGKDHGLAQLGAILPGGEGGEHRLPRLGGQAGLGLLGRREPRHGQVQLGGRRR